MINNLQRFRLIAFLEGLSFIFLLGVAMPLKYIYNSPALTSVTGMIHGVLFILYILFLMIVKKERSWNLSTSILAFIAALLPFGTFVADSMIFKKQ